MKTTISSKISKLTATISRPGGKSELWWKVTTPRPGGGRTRRFFQTEQEADTYIEQQSIQLANYGTAGAAMDDRLRVAAVRAQEILQPLGLDLVEAARHYASHIQSTMGGIPLTEAAHLLLKDREKPRYSPVYRKNLESRVTRFVQSFPEGKTTRQVSPDDVETFLDGLHQIGRSAGTMESYRKEIFTLFSFALERGYCSENPAKRIKRDEIQYRVEILTPQQCAKLLEACDAETLPSVAIGMFCGLRTSELARLDWSKVNLSEQIVVVDSSVARKTGARRVVPMPEACKEWLTPYAKPDGAVQPSDFRNTFDRVRVRAGFKPSFSDRKDTALQELLTDAKRRKVKLLPWPSNCLRHSAISFGMADCGDPGKVSGWAGNSPAMIRRHYDAQATPSAARAFYAIRPETPGNVLPMGKAKAA
jgi:integrase